MTAGIRFGWSTNGGIFKVCGDNEGWCTSNTYLMDNTDDSIRLRKFCRPNFTD